MAQQYYPPHYTQPQGNGFGVAAMVLGIVAVVLSVIPILGIGGFLLGLLALIFGIVGLTRMNRPKGTSVAGLVLGLVAMVLGAIITIFLANVFGSVAEEASAPVMSGEATESVVVYEVTSDAPTIGNVTYMTFNNGGSGMEQATDTPAPFIKEIDLGEQGVFDSNLFSLTGQSGASATTITCKITLDGEVISEQTSTGEYALVSCSESRF